MPLIMAKPPEKDILDFTLGEVVIAVRTQAVPAAVVFIAQAIAFTYTLGYTFGVGLHTANDRFTRFVTTETIQSRISQLQKTLGALYQAIQNELQAFSQI